MKTWRVLMMTVCGFGVAGCAAPSEPSGGERSGSPPTQSASAPGAADADAIPASVARLFSRMEAVGPGSQAAYDQELQDFLRADDPLATLTKAYAQLPAGATGSRWKAIYAAGEVRTPASVAFLEQVALAPSEMAPADVLGHGHGEGDQSYALRLTAAVAIVRHQVNNVAGADKAAERLLAGADPQIAQMVGVELFSEGRLTPARQQALAARGISTKFRILPGAEADRLRTVNPAATRHQGGDAREQSNDAAVKTRLGTPPGQDSP